MRFGANSWARSPISRFAMTSSISENGIRAVWRKADGVCFDVDSTVCKDEGLDELAEFCGVGPEVAQLTAKAMGGDVSFREALTQRLNIVRPSCQQIKEFLRTRAPNLSDGIKDLVQKLHKRNVTVFLVSGGFRSIIRPVGELLSISDDHIFANRLLHDKDGEYTGFDFDEPTSESGGKKRVVELVKKKFNIQCLVMVGDGATDMEAAPPADAFIGYGGNVVREKVCAGAQWFVTDFHELSSELDKEPATEA